MNTYRIRLISLPHAIVLGIVFLLLFPMVSLLLPRPGFLLLPLGVLLILALVRNLATAETRWELHEKGVDLYWESHFPFARKPELSLDWAELRRFDPYRRRNSEGFVLTLGNGRRMRFRHYTWARTITGNSLRTSTTDSGMYWRRVHPLFSRNECSNPTPC